MIKIWDQRFLNSESGIKEGKKRYYLPYIDVNFRNYNVSRLNEKNFHRVNNI